MRGGCALYPIHTVCLQKPPPRTAQCLSFTQFLLRIDPRGGSIALALPSSFLPCPDYQLRPPSVLNRNRKGFFSARRKKREVTALPSFSLFPKTKLQKRVFVAQLPNFSSFFISWQRRKWTPVTGLLGSGERGRWAVADRETILIPSLLGRRRRRRPLFCSTSCHRRL